MWIMSIPKHRGHLYILTEEQPRIIWVCWIDSLYLLSVKKKQNDDGSAIDQFRVCCDYQGDQHYFSKWFPFCAFFFLYLLHIFHWEVEEKEQQSCFLNASNVSKQAEQTDSEQHDDSSRVHVHLMFLGSISLGLNGRWLGWVLFFVRINSEFWENVRLDLSSNVVPQFCLISQISEFVQYWLRSLNFSELTFEELHIWPQSSSFSAS